MSAAGDVIAAGMKGLRMASHTLRERADLGACVVYEDFEVVGLITTEWFQQPDIWLGISLLSQAFSFFLYK